MWSEAERARDPGRERARRPTSLSNVVAGGDAWRKHQPRAPSPPSAARPHYPTVEPAGPGGND